MSTPDTLQLLQGNGFIEYQSQPDISGGKKDPRTSHTAGMYILLEFIYIWGRCIL